MMVETTSVTATGPTTAAPEIIHDWYKDAILYEISLRSFFDSSNDGNGDFLGLMSKLDYVQSLGVTCIWLLPFYVSPLRDGGYDIADFREIHPDYGTLDDFKAFLDEAHRRGLRVVTELVINHTSDQHMWFQEARKDPHSPYRDYYVWSDTDQRYQDARIIFTDTEPSNWTWDNVAGAYYWHRFFSHQPDLNFDNPKVIEEVLSVMDFWLEMGVDGLRLDAIPYLFEREGTNCENLPETHAVLKQIRAHVSGADVAGRSESMAGRCAPLLRRWRRMPHGLPLPGDAANLHGDPAGRAQADRRDPAADPRFAGERPVVPLPPQSRRTDARDGHR
jgi:maltose alpha-D-glucosyltransferase/alpha-amylase